MLRFLLPLIAIAALATPMLDACTGLKLKSRDGGTVRGRTLEFGVKIDTSIVVVGRGQNFQGAEGSGLRYTSNYACVGAIAFDQLAILDGMNEKGLSVGTFYFPGFASYQTLTADNQARALSPLDFPNWIVTNFATIQEVKQALGSVVIASIVSKEWGNIVPPFHYAVYDKSGECLVIEPMHGKLVTHDNPLGVFTNSPGFDWHLTNLRNFINLTPINAPPITIDTLKLSPFGQGSGMVGLPGDFTPPSRFVRASIFQATSQPPRTSEDGIFQLFHILNQFDIPVGVAQGHEHGLKTFDYTLMTAACNPKALRYYFRTYDDQTIRFVDLNSFDLDNVSVKKMKTAQFQQPAVDMSSDLK